MSFYVTLCYIIIILFLCYENLMSMQIAQIRKFSTPKSEVTVQPEEGGLPSLSLWNVFTSSGGVQVSWGVVHV